MKAYELRFDGALIERGFWLYVWRITHGKDKMIYVGRTGDSSSRYAASPFRRLGQHLDTRPNAKANTLLKNIKAENIDPVNCVFELVSVGPIFPEQNSIEEHRRYRDIVASLEAALAEHFKKSGFKVLGTHPMLKSVDEDLLSKVLTLIKGRF